MSVKEPVFQNGLRNREGLFPLPNRQQKLKIWKMEKNGEF